jgi:hypothetical protein
MKWFFNTGLKLTQSVCCGSGSAFNLPPGSGSGFGMQIRIQLLKYLRQKQKFTLIIKVVRDIYI